MAQGVLPFKYEAEKNRSGMTALAGLPTYLELASVCRPRFAAARSSSEVTYWGSAPPTDPFYASLVFGGNMNRWAALFSGLSALCASLSVLSQHLRREKPGKR
jgi:hypothetical protein